ncbi:MAG: hypothetical protein HKO95_09665 [Rhodobacteraceae bacterium]|nr:flagellar protein FlgN [Alphaproteobacteria bacterium]MBT8476623.1 flagellar protein FlgN [Alphaproteobacteria bacterium]NNK66992.1 hypothetical protein [Paracoccaceae bacterium]
MPDNRAVTRLMTYLAQEREVLQRGKVEALAALVTEKEALLEELSRTPPPAGDLARLRRAAARNQRLMSAAAEGVKSVLTRLKEYERAGGPIQSYSGSGAPRQIGGSPPTLERKA